jgi:TolB-like protein/Tfp pilus assembly protein PilF
VPDIFLSYNREDQARAKVFAEAFERQGLKVWWDVGLRTGEAYDEVTETALRTAKAVVVLWSKKSVQSRWVRAEATLADRNKTLVPCMIEPCERPIMFELTQTAELSHWQGEAGDQAWAAFLADVKRFVQKDAPPPSVVPAAQAPPVSKTGGPPTLAVLPFNNRSGLSEDEVFADGMVEDIIAALSHGASAVRVLASNATAPYRKGLTDLAETGRKLGARYMLEGNVRRAGASLRVTTQLVEAETSNILWTAKFDRPLAELADLQEELVAEVAGHLGGQVQRVEMERALKKPGDITAWEALMRSHSATARLGPESMLFTLAEQRKAVAIAPDYAAAHSALAVTLSSMLFWHGYDEAIRREILVHTQRALDLQPNNPNVLAGAAWGYVGVGRYADALTWATRAKDLNPNFPLIHTTLGFVATYQGRFDDALAAFEAAARVAPHGLSAFHDTFLQSTAALFAGHTEQAIAAVDRAIQLNPRFVSSWLFRALICEDLGRHDEARDAMRRMREAQPEAQYDRFVWWLTFYIKGPPFAASSMNPKADDILSTFHRLWDETSA